MAARKKSARRSGLMNKNTRKLLERLDRSNPNVSGHQAPAKSKRTTKPKRR